MFTLIIYVHLLVRIACAKSIPTGTDTRRSSSQWRHRVVIWYYHSLALVRVLHLLRFILRLPESLFWWWLWSFTLNRESAVRCLGSIRSGNDGNIAHCSSLSGFTLLFWLSLWHAGAKLTIPFLFLCLYLCVGAVMTHARDPGKFNLSLFWSRIWRDASVSYKSLFEPQEFENFQSK